MVYKYYRYLPFAKRLKARIVELWGVCNGDSMREVSKLLGVPAGTVYCWLEGNSIPKSLERRAALGVLLGICKGKDDKGGLCSTYEYFIGEEPKTPEKKRKRYVKVRKNYRKMSKMKKWQKLGKQELREKKRANTQGESN